MALPLPRVVADVGPGGGIVTSMRGINALKSDMLLNKMRELQNQYYGPNIESEIDQRKALTQGQTIQNQYMPQKMQLQNALMQLQNQYYGPNMQSQIAQRNALTQGQTIKNQFAPETSRLANEHQALVNQLYPELTRAQIANYNSGGSRAGADQKAMAAFKQQLMLDNNVDERTANQIASSALEGTNILPNGQPMPKLSGVAQDMLTKIQRRNSTAAVQNQAANMDVLASDLNDINIEPVARFAGPKGKIEFAKQSYNMATGQPVSQDFRDYLAFKNVTANFAMDALRKGFGTSVVPEYVYSTLGKASNPASSFWNDPIQVHKEWNITKDWINKNAKKYTTKATKGVSANISSNQEMVTIRNKKTGEQKIVTRAEANKLMGKK